MLDAALTAELARAARPKEVVAKLDTDDVHTVAKEFESVFLSTMMEHMFAGVETDGPFGGGNAERTWRSFLIEEYAASIADRGGIGLADGVARELLTHQETVTHDPD